MPDGFYSGDKPNSHLRQFVEDHATSYDPTSDEYRVGAFAEHIQAKKSTAIYNLHTYWSKKPHDAIQQYIRHYTTSGDTVLDPMCGSGSTALAALMDGRNAIAIDLSPAATFITKLYCTPISLADFDKAFQQLDAALGAEMEQLYHSDCSRCGGPATVTFTVYSQVYQCPRCLEDVALFDCPEEMALGSDDEQRRVTVCPHCLKKRHKEEISSRLSRKGFKVVSIGYECNGKNGKPCKPRRGSRHHATTDIPEQHAFAQDLAHLEDIRSRTIPFPIPQQRMMNCAEGVTEWGLLWRPYHDGIDKVTDFFTSRNLLALLTLKHAITQLSVSPDVRDFLLGGVTAILHKSSRMMGYRHDGVGRVMTGTYWIPQLIKDINVWRYFREWYGDARRHVAQKNSSFSSADAKVIISTQNATSLGDIPSDSIDYIFTDPPYSWKVQFGEANFLWEAFMGFDTKWLDDEIIVNEHRKMTEGEWAGRLVLVLKECFRVLKPGRWMSICYHDTSEGTWAVLQDLLAEAGFVASEVAETLVIDSDQKSIKQITADKVAKRDLVLNLRKPVRGHWIVSRIYIPADVDAPTFMDLGRHIIKDYLTNHPGASKDRIYDAVVGCMVRKGQMEAHDFDALLRSVAEEVQQPVHEGLFRYRKPDLFGSHIQSRWYLKESADQVDQVEQAKEDAVVSRLSKFIGEYLKKNPEDEGVHYSELFEQYLPVQDKPRRLLADWLPEYFIKTPGGTWQVPDKKDAEQLAKLREAGTLRQIKRFANALIEGVPVRDKDRPGSHVDLLDWLRQCRRAGMYEQGKAIYEKGGLNSANLTEEKQIEAEDDYRICARRGSTEEAKPKRQRRKKQDDDE